MNGMLSAYYTGTLDFKDPHKHTQTKFEFTFFSSRQFESRDMHQIHCENVVGKSDFPPVSTHSVQTEHWIQWLYIYIMLTVTQPRQ